MLKFIGSSGPEDSTARKLGCAISMAFGRFDTQLMCFSASLSGDLKAEIHVMCIAAK